MAGRPKAVAIFSAAISCLLLLASCQPDTPTEVAPTKSIAPSPTPSEPTVLEVFEELRERAAAIYAGRDFSAMKNVYIRNGPTWKRVLKDLRVMRRADVTFVNLDRSMNVEVIKASDTRIVIRETIVSDGKFLNAEGEDVTGERNKERQVLRWILRRNNRRFLIFDSIILKARPMAEH